MCVCLRDEGLDLAVDHHYQGRGIGSLLLLDALYRSLHLSAGIGMSAVVVDAKDDLAAQFYRHFDFEAFPESSLTLWLPTTALDRLFPPENQT